MHRSNLLVVLAFLAVMAPALPQPARSEPNRPANPLTAGPAPGLNAQLIRLIMSASVAREPSAASVQDLLDKGADPNARGTVFHPSGPDRKATAAHGPTALMLAAWWGEADVVKVLLAAGADIEARDGHGSTPLMYAAGGDQTRSSVAVAELLDAGVHVNAQDNRGGTALIIAARRGDASEVEMLLSAGADANLKGGDDYWDVLLNAYLGSAQVPGGLFGTVTPLMAAVNSGSVTTVNTLLSAGADVNAAQANGTTALMYAASNGNIAVIEALLAAGATVSPGDRWGHTAL
ncbi:MAG: ankyrin repeat domain-containing protein [Capsulimonadaceae bacterium]